MKKKTLLIAVVAIALAVVTAASVTVAWLNVTSNEVTNTFTYGKIEITLTEENGTNTQGIDYTRVVPGDKLDKDPTVTVKAKSEDCFVYVLVTNDLGTAATYDIDSNIWIEIESKDNSVLYRYNNDNPVEYSDEDQSLPVFSKIIFSEYLTVSDVEALEKKNVVIKAYAHQSKNTSQDVADEAAIEWAGLN